MILVFGQTGQVARALARQASDALCLPRAAADLTRPAQCAALIAHHRPAAVINAAAFTAVDRAEAEEETAMRVNAHAPGAMAAACADMGIPFVHLSTDYVFPGTGDTPWRPDDTTAPLNAYGRSKLAGEAAVRAAGGVHVILRTSWVFSADGANFVTSMLRLAQTRDSLQIVADQIGGPTPAAAIADCCLTIAARLQTAPDCSGTYHFAGAADVSWADFARTIFAEAGLAVSVSDIPASAYPTAAIRPANSRLDCTTTETVFGVARPDWRAALRTLLPDLLDAHPAERRIAT